MKPIWVKEEKLILEVKNISVYYGSIKGIENVSFFVNSNEIVTMIGPNGSGKSTALKALFGMVELKEGSIFFNNESIINLRPDERVIKGISLIPEGRRLFPSMTVTENLEMGAFTLNKKNINSQIEQIFDFFPLLKENKHKKAGILSIGEQQILAMGRALMQKPKLLLADEPSLGLSPKYVDLIFTKLIEINKSGTSILFVEQNAQMALEVAHRGYVFQYGNIILQDTGANLLKSEEVRKAFLGWK